MLLANSQFAVPRILELVDSIAVVGAVVVVAAAATESMEAAAMFVRLLVANWRVCC